MAVCRLILLVKVLRIRPVVMITPTWRANCRCFSTGKPTKGVPEVVYCAVRIVIRRPRTQRYAQGHRDTRFIQVRVAKVELEK
jgi:hypothetical protein